MSTDQLDHPQVKLVPPLVYLAGLIIGWLLTLWWPTPLVDVGIAWLAGAVLGLCGIGLAVPAIVAFRRNGAPLRPDRASPRLVQSGPYRFSRNPMYTGLALVYLGIAVGLQSLWALLLLVAVLAIIRTRVIAPEEAFLRQRFGASYEDFTRRVRRWL